MLLVERGSNLTATSISHHVEIELFAILHNALPAEALTNCFNLMINISDGGRNTSGLMTLENQYIEPGTQYVVKQKIFDGYYNTISVGDITMTFIAMGGGEIGGYEIITRDDNVIQPGKQYFQARAILETINGKRSELVLSGSLKLD